MLSELEIFGVLMDIKNLDDNSQFILYTVKLTAILEYITVIVNIVIL